jgi:hypothetical protein
MTNRIQSIFSWAFVSGLALLLAACGGGGGGGGSPSSNYTCNLPCLASNPALSASTISGTTGGSISVTFAVQGDLANISVISIIMASPNITTLTLPAGAGAITAPITQTPVTVPIKINAGTAPGTYYPSISIVAKAPANYGGENFIDPTKITTQYTYTEVLGSTTAGPHLTPFAVPLLTVQ